MFRLKAYLLCSLPSPGYKAFVYTDTSFCLKKNIYTYIYIKNLCPLNTFQIFCLAMVFVCAHIFQKIKKKGKPAPVLVFVSNLLWSRLDGDDWKCHHLLVVCFLVWFLLFGIVIFPTMCVPFHPSAVSSKSKPLVKAIISQFKQLEVQVSLLSHCGTLH